MKQRSLFKLLALLLALALAAAACGGSDDGDGDTATGGDDDTAADDGGGDDAAEEEEEEEEAEEDVIEAGEEAEGDVDTEVEVVEEERTVGGSIAVGLEAESTGLRPWEDTCSSPCYNILITLFDKLMEQDSEGNYVPYLLESISSNEDFTVWTGTLRSGVSFHNGDGLTAQHIADMFPIQAAGATGAGAVSAANLAEVNATGELEVQWVLSRGSAAFPAYLSRASLGMVHSLSSLRTAASFVSA